MRDLFAKAAVNPVRQRTQYSCMSASAAMAFNALGYTTTEDEVNKVMGAAPMQGAAWEQALATAQHYGCRATLTCPSTVGQLKDWTDRGIPVMIAWNPEGREWSHASLVFDVVEDPEQGTLVYVADPNIPDPDERVRIVPKKDFYAKWYEKWPNYMVRRPAMAIEREITADGRQVMAARSAKDITLKIEPTYGGKPYGKEFVTEVMRHPGNGAHNNRDRDLARGNSRKEKFKKDLRNMEASVSRIAFISMLATRIAAREALMKNAGPLTDVSRLRFQAVFLMGAGGSGKGFVAQRWMKYMPGSPSNLSDTSDMYKRKLTEEERGLSNLNFEKAKANLEKKGVRIELVEGQAGIPFRLYSYDARGAQALIEPKDWEKSLPPQVYAEVLGLENVIFSTPKHELPSYWRQVNPDLYKEELAGYLEAQPGYVHEMSSEMAKAYFEAALETGDPLFVDGTGSNAAKVADQIKAAQAHGYRAQLVLVIVPLTVNHIRNGKRDRKVGALEVTRQWKLIEKNFHLLKGLADKSRVIQNRNDAHDLGTYKKYAEVINGHIRATSHGQYSNLYELIKAENPEELAEWGDVIAP